VTWTRALVPVVHPDRSDGSVPVTLALAGRHQVANTLAAAAVRYELGLTLPALATALADLRPAPPEGWMSSTGRRCHRDRRLVQRQPGIGLAALRALAVLGRGRRTVAVLRYLAELGRYERARHEEVGRLAAGWASTGCWWSATRPGRSATAPRR
jgi:UDP-N-acetylmuramoyl-tripeptide--D-alanyl-D-alanine ligase